MTLWVTIAATVLRRDPPPPQLSHACSHISLCRHVRVGVGALNTTPRISGENRTFALGKNKRGKLGELFDRLKGRGMQVAESELLLDSTLQERKYLPRGDRW
jgi:hypothetical protein